MGPKLLEKYGTLGAVSGALMRGWGLGVGVRGWGCEGGCLSRWRSTGHWARFQVHSCVGGSWAWGCGGEGEGEGGVGGVRYLHILKNF